MTRNVEILIFLFTYSCCFFVILWYNDLIQVQRVGTADHIADGTLALCDRLRCYHALVGIADWILKDCNEMYLF